jgi:hypothetical protein
MNKWSNYGKWRHPKKRSEFMNKPESTEDELWDYYSGLPNPMWYQRVKELEDEEDDTDDSTDTSVTTE